MRKGKQTEKKVDKYEESPSGQVVSLLRALGSIPGQGTKILQAVWHGQNKKPKYSNNNK